MKSSPAPFAAGPAAKSQCGTPQEYVLARWFELASGDDDWRFPKPFVPLRRIGDLILAGYPTRVMTRLGDFGPYSEVDGVALRILDLANDRAGMQVLSYDFTTQWCATRLEALLFSDEMAGKEAFEEFAKRSERWQGYPRERLVTMLTAKGREALGLCEDAPAIAGGASACPAP